jgi:L-alanine-DL-glutamate epimerase-like enolase superfamily enzyme
VSAQAPRPACTRPEHGKAAGLPVYQLLGGYRTSILAYASTVAFDSVEEYRDVADQCLALGYPAIKLHAWGDARRDAALCQAVRAHVGDAVPLMYDGSAGFDLADAVYVGHALAEAGYLWYEEPMREFSITAYRSLVMTNPVVREPAVDEQGLVHAPIAPGIGFEAHWGDTLPGRKKRPHIPGLKLLGCTV